MISGVPSSHIVQELEYDLFHSYDKSVLPKTTLEKGVAVTLDLALNQIIDVVSSLKAITDINRLRSLRDCHSVLVEPH